MVAPKKAPAWKSAAARRLLQLAGNAATVDEAVTNIVSTTLEGISYPPLVLEDLFTKLNISGVRIEDDLPFSGELRPDNGHFIIVCSKHLSANRRRFTIAHELAHAIFELSGPKCPRSGRELERLCDMIAAEFLMPWRAFKARAGDVPGVDQVLQLARVFQTSLTATAIRCNKLFDVTIFAAQTDAVLWGYGAIRKGPTRHLDSTLRRLIREAQSLPKGTQVLPLEIRGTLRSWVVQYRSIGNEQTLFVLQPLREKMVHDIPPEDIWSTPVVIR
jgi:Zn-dependent peptidase ImmA (M78 family)